MLVQSVALLQAYEQARRSYPAAGTLLIAVESADIEPGRVPETNPAILRRQAPVFVQPLPLPSTAQLCRGAL